MATVTIDATHPSATVNFSVLRALCDRLLTADRLGQFQLGSDEYTLLWELVYGGTDGVTVAGVTSQAVITYT